MMANRERKPRGLSRGKGRLAKMYDVPPPPAGEIRKGWKAAVEQHMERYRQGRRP